MSEKIKFNSTRFGELEINKDAIINFPVGIIGFPDAHEFVMLDYNAPFSWLHSVDQPNIAFVVVNGAEFGEDYSFDLPYGDKEITLEKDDEIALVNLVTVRPEVDMTTVNLKAPIIVNMKNRMAKQVVIDNPNLPIRLPIFNSNDTNSNI